MWRVLNGEIGDYFLDKVKEKGYVGLGWFDAGVRSFYTIDKPIKTLDDLKGLNIRVMESSLMLDMIEALGANGIMLSYGQVYSSLQTGAIDGAENNFASFVTASHLEVAKYYSVDEHVRIPEIIIASEKTFAKISLEDQEIIKRVAKEITEYQKELWEKRDLELKQVILDAGVEINYIEDKSEFIKAVEPIYEDYPEFKELIEKIKNQ
jgi:TRAP-type C4-dicarboxylate transport system substrate-binding protein